MSLFCIFCLGTLNCWELWSWRDFLDSSLLIWWLLKIDSFRDSCLPVNASYYLGMPSLKFEWRDGSTISILVVNPSELNFGLAVAMFFINQIYKLNKKLICLRISELTKLSSYCSIFKLALTPIYFCRNWDTLSFDSINLAKAYYFLSSLLLS